MATKGKRESVSTPRPSLDEVKMQPGRNLFATYEGTKFGGLGIPALRPRFAGDVPEELQIEAWTPKMIAEEWLDDVRFRDLYEKTEGLKVWKTDAFPQPPDLKLPEELDQAIKNDNRKQFALQLAKSEYNEQFMDVVGMTDHESAPQDARRWEQEELYPFLQVLLFYETRLLNRPEVIKAIDKRLKSLDDEAAKRARRRW